MGKMEILTSCEIETIEQIDTQFVKINYVHERNVCSKLLNINMLHNHPSVHFGHVRVSFLAGTDTTAAAHWALCMLPDSAAVVANTVLPFCFLAQLVLPLLDCMLKSADPCLTLWVLCNSSLTLNKVNKFTEVYFLVILF